MLYKIGYEVVYRDGAFKTRHHQSVTTHRWSPLPDIILDALEFGRDTVLATSEAKWIVIITACVQHGTRTDDILAKLVVYIPADADQERELLEALASFEEVIGEHLGIPVDTAYRSIEGDDLVCVFCGEKPKWRYPSSTGFDDYACGLHVKLDPRFAKFGLIPIQEETIIT